MTNLRLSRRRALQALALLGQPALATVPHDAHHALVQLLRGAAKDWVATGNSYAKEVRKFRQLDAPRAENTAFPKDPRKAYAKDVWKVARQHLPTASATQLQAWRQQLPFAYSPLIDVYADVSCSVSHCVALGDDALVAVVQGFRGHQHVAAFMDPGAKAWRYVPGIHCLGRSPNGQWIAQANPKGIAVSGTDLRTQYWFDYPRGNEGTPERLKLKPAANPKEAEVLVPFNDGKRLLLGNSTGVYLLQANSKQGAVPVKRLHPHRFDEEDYSSGDEIDLAMVHVALSPDGRWIALGSQDSQHILMNTQGKVLAELESENYPHHAVFDAQSRQVLLNESHLYNGWTRKVNLPTAQAATPIPMEFSKEMADDDLRVYSSLRQGSRIYLGGSGDVSALDSEGRPQWTQFVGGTIKALDSTPSGDIWVANYSGLLERYRADPSTPNEARIGTGDWHNVERWIFVADAAHPFAW